MASDHCIMCTKLPNDLKCTLHGGHMTATEVNLRFKYEIVDDKWVERAADEPDVRATAKLMRERLAEEFSSLLKPR